MDKFFARFGLVMMVVLPVACITTLWRDLRHPEWSTDWTHNPHLYLPLILLMAVPLLVYAAYVFSEIRRSNRQIKQRSAYLDYLRKINKK